MPWKCDSIPPMLHGKRGDIYRDLAKKTSEYQLYIAAIERERRDLRAIADAHWDMIHACEVRLDGLWDTIKKRHPEGVELWYMMRHLWSSFEGDVRFLCDHIMEDDPIDKASMAHAAASALIGLHSIITACVRNEDQPFEMKEMLKVIADFGGDFKS